MEAKEPLRAFSNFVSLFMLFVSFFTNFFMGESLILNSFIRGIITYLIAKIIMAIVIFIWRVSFSRDEWRLLSNPPKEFHENYLNISDTNE